MIKSLKKGDLKMTVSNTKRIGIKKYQQEKCDRITADIPKGKRDAYKMIAAEKGLSLSQLIQNSVESFAGLHGGELPASVSTSTRESISAADKRLVDEFNQLPVEAQKHFLKAFRAINEVKPAPMREDREDKI